MNSSALSDTFAEKFEARGEGGRARGRVVRSESLGDAWSEPQERVERDGQ